MKNIKTKSILELPSKQDGIRICVMRHIRPEYKFDLWIPNLSPSEKLLKEYVITKRIDWKEFSKKFKKQVIQKQTKLVALLVTISKENKITLLCAEESVTYCHRALLLDAIISQASQTRRDNPSQSSAAVQ